MNRPILVALTGTPTARAAFSSPPTAKIQFPTRVRISTQVATATSAIQMNTVILTSTPADVHRGGKHRPGRVEAVHVGDRRRGHDPPIRRVRPRFRPVSIRNVARVTMKLGSLVFIRIQPLMNPMARDTSKARSDADPDVRAEVPAEHRRRQGRGDHGDTGGKVKLAADHQQRHPHRHDPDRGTAVQDGGQGVGLGKRRGNQREEDEEDDRAHEGAHLGAAEELLDRAALADPLVGRRRLGAWSGSWS